MGAQPDTVETKAFKITGISHDETEFMGVSSQSLRITYHHNHLSSLRHHKDVGGLSGFYHLLSCLAPFALSLLCTPKVSARHTQSTTNPILVKLPKSRITAHLHSFLPLFFPACETIFHILFNLILPLQVSKTAVHHDRPQSKTMIFLQKKSEGEGLAKKPFGSWRCFPLIVFTIGPVSYVQEVYFVL